MNSTDLEKIALLAYIDIKDVASLLDETNTMLNLINTLQQVDTSSVEPLIHPLDLYQPLREDNCAEDNCLSALADIAPLFTDDLYIVPNVIRGK